MKTSAMKNVFLGTVLTLGMTSIMSPAIAGGNHGGNGYKSHHHMSPIVQHKKIVQHTPYGKKVVTVTIKTYPMRGKVSHRKHWKNSYQKPHHHHYSKGYHSGQHSSPHRVERTLNRALEREIHQVVHRLFQH